MNLNSMPGLQSSSVKAQEFFEKPGTNIESHDTEAGDGLVERQAGGSQHGVEAANAKRSKGKSGSQKTPGSKNKALENLDDCLKSLMISQMRESSMEVEEGVMTLIRKCLTSSPKGARFVVVAGNTDHYASKADVDIGWGCGWRNIQMLASHFISEDAEIRETLFGGAGYVPDIPALQQWMEIAWAKGFDVPGGEFFDWKIKDTHKCIGTTEGAALLRSFGVRARIVDFQATGRKREKQSELRSKAGSKEGSSEKGEEGGSGRSGDEPSDSARNETDGGEASEPQQTASNNGEPDLACIVCSEHILDNSEFRRHNEDSDMCPQCLKRLQDSGNTDKENITDECETQITGRHRHGWNAKTGGGGSNEGETTVKHQQMVEWVWKYFMADAVASDTCKALHLSRRSPLYFQHRGHSQTLIGIERRQVSTSPDSEEVNLLVLDPSEETSDIVDSLRKNRGWERFVKRGLQTLKQQEYQLCYGERGVAKGKELENLKILSSRSYTY